MRRTSSRGMPFTFTLPVRDPSLGLDGYSWQSAQAISERGAHRLRGPF